MPESLMDALNMTVTTTTKELVEISMPISAVTKQPMGYLHGGATVALAETAASIGGLQHVDPKNKAVVGLEINCNHLKARNDGCLTAKAAPIHIGKKTMVWEVKVMDEHNQLIAISRCTLAVIDLREKQIPTNKVRR